MKIEAPLTQRVSNRTEEPESLDFICRNKKQEQINRRKEIHETQNDAYSRRPSLRSLWHCRNLRLSTNRGARTVLCNAIVGSDPPGGDKVHRAVEHGQQRRP